MLGRPVDGHEEIEVALGCLHLGNTNMDVADGIALESRLDRLVAAGNGAEMNVSDGDGRLQRVQAVVQRQQGMPTKSVDRIFILH